MREIPDEMFERLAKLVNGRLDIDDRAIVVEVPEYMDDITRIYFWPGQDDETPFWFATLGDEETDSAGEIMTRIGAGSDDYNRIALWMKGIIASYQVY